MEIKQNISEKHSDIIPELGSKDHIRELNKKGIQEEDPLLSNHSKLSLENSLVNIANEVSENSEEDYGEPTYSIFIMNLLPNIGSNGFYIFVQLIEAHFIGQTKNNDLVVAIYLAQAYNTFLLFFIGYGLVDVMNTICSRSSSQKNLYKHGTQTNQVRLILTVYITTISIIGFLWADKILSIFVGNVSYLYDSHTYIKYATPSVFMSLHYEIYCRYFETQLVYSPVIYSLLPCIISHPFICWFFISHLKMGLLGAAICSNITEFLRLFIIVIFAGCCNPFPQSNICFDMNIFKNFWKVLKLAVVSAALFFGESASMNILEFISARLGTLAFAQHIALMNITQIAFALNAAFINSNSILVGHYAGKNSPENVKKIMKISFITCLIVFLPFSIIKTIFPSIFLFFFNESDDVWKSEGIIVLVYIMNISNLFDFAQACLQGYLRGLEILNITFITSFVSYCLILPLLCYFLAFYLQWNLKGIWISLLITNLLVTLVNCWILFSFDLKEICDKLELDDSKDISQINTEEELIIIFKEN